MAFCKRLFLLFDWRMNLTYMWRDGNYRLNFPPVFRAKMGWCKFLFSCLKFLVLPKLSGQGDLGLALLVVFPIKQRAWSPPLLNRDLVQLLKRWSNIPKNYWRHSTLVNSSESLHIYGSRDTTHRPVNLHMSELLMMCITSHRIHTPIHHCCL